jgi:hypothetical protein
LIYSYDLEITFSNIFFISGVVGVEGWHSDTQKIVFEIPENEHKLNQKYGIQQGYQLFRFVTEDFKNDIIIATNAVSYNTDKNPFDKNFR